MSGTMHEGTMHGKANLAGAWAFFLDELRRGAMAVAGGLLAVIALALVPRLMPNALTASGDELRLAAAVAGLVFVLPLVGLYLATSGWARERADGTLGWLYTRPLSADALFWLRTAAFTTSLAIFATLVLLATWTTPAAVFSNPAIGDLYSLYRYTPVLFPALAGSLFVSATAGRGRLAPMLAGTLGALAGLALLAELPLPRWELLADPEAAYLRRCVLLYGVYPLALVAGAWAAVRGAVVDRRTRWRGVVVAAAIAVLGALVSVALAANQTWGDPWRPVAVRELPGGGEVRLSNGHGYASFVVHLDLTVDGGERSLPGEFLAPRLFVSPRGGLAIFEGALSKPRMRWIDGEEERWVEFDEAAATPVGWSPDGRRLAVQRNEPAADGLLLFDADTASLRPLPLPWLDGQAGGNWSAEWIDERHVFLWSFSRGGWWAVADVEGGRVAQGRLDEGALLQPSPARFWSPRREGGGFPVAPDPVARRDGELLLWRWGRGDGSALIAVGPEGELEVLAERASQELWGFSLGVVGRTVVWVEQGRVRALDADGAGVRPSCAVPDGFHAGAFRGASGRFAVWASARHAADHGDRLFVCDVGNGTGELVGDLGPWGGESAQVTEEGLLTPTGLRPLGG